MALRSPTPSIHFVPPFVATFFSSAALPSFGRAPSCEAAASQKRAVVVKGKTCGNLSPPSPRDTIRVRLYAVLQAQVRVSYRQCSRWSFQIGSRCTRAKILGSSFFGAASSGAAAEEVVVAVVVVVGNGRTCPGISRRDIIPTRNVVQAGTSVGGTPPAHPSRRKTITHASARPERAPASRSI